MLSKLTEEEILARSCDSTYYNFVDDFIELNECLAESGIALFGKNKSIMSMYKCDSKEETISMMKKVIAVSDLSEEEISKFDKVREVLQRFFDVCFRKKFSVFLLAMAFIGMFVMGIKERIYLICLMYTWGFFTITDTSNALKIVKESIEEYKVREDALADKEFMEFFDTIVRDDIEDVLIYSLKK